MKVTNRVAWFGLGRMGRPMVANLLKAGINVVGFDAYPDAASELIHKVGFKTSSTAAEAAEGSDVVILMLPDSAAVDDLLWGDKGIACLLPCGGLLIDMGSSKPLHSRENARRLAELKVDFLDAPVSGGVKRAAEASLAIMVGGSVSTVEAVKPYLEAMGKAIFHVGGAGSAHAVKALNNYVSAAGLIAVSEALVAAEKFGIDPHAVNRVFNASTGKNNTTEHKVEAFMLSGTYDSGFSLALMRKDVQTASAFIDEMGTNGDFARLCFEISKAADRGLGSGADHTAVHAFIGGNQSIHRV